MKITKKRFNGAFIFSNRHLISQFIKIKQTWKYIFAHIKLLNMFAQKVYMTLFLVLSFYFQTSIRMYMKRTLLLKSDGKKKKKLNRIKNTMRGCL